MRGIDGLLQDLEAQRAYVTPRAPVYGRLLELLPQALPFDRLERAWADRSFDAWFERPLLILASLRDDALQQGPTHPLHAAIGGGSDVDAATPGALAAALAPDQGLWRKLPRRRLQTNETSRAVAWLWPAHLLADADPGCSVQLLDIGTSAGLNLVADALPRIWSRHDHAPLALDPLPAIVSRRGFDLAPVDVTDEDAARWLRACIWPGQKTRLDRLEQAITAWRRSDPRPDLVAAAAGDTPGLLPRDGRYLLAVQTVLKGFLRPGERERYEAGMRRWLADTPPGHALWAELEVTDAARTDGPAAQLTVHLQDASFALATCDAHPIVMTVDDVAVAALRSRLSGTVSSRVR
jgi:hypothetical protein